MPRKIPSARSPRASAKKGQSTSPRPPFLDRSDIRTILYELANRVAPADVTALLDAESELRARAADLDHLQLLAAQLTLALDCLHDHVRGDCPQIPYYTISLLAAAVHYFADKLDVVPDFLPRIGRLDDAAVMAMACQLTTDGLRRYCDWKGRSADAVLGPAPARSRA
jgi:uncharacterized membrane protein YkvA (DUF1232 family)